MALTEELLTEEQNALLSEFEAAELAYKNSAEVYREAKAQKYLDLVNPEGKPATWKKPTETAVTSLIDTDPHIIELRRARIEAEVKYDVLKNKLNFVAYC